VKNQNFEVSCEVLSEIELQEIVGGGVMSWLTSCFKPSDPKVKVALPDGTTMKVRQSEMNYVRTFPST